MNTTTAQGSVKSLYSEIFGLTPSSLLTMFEIDARDLAFDLGLISDVSSNRNYIFRFHNNTKLGKTSLHWQENEYIAAPIEAEGFEISARGTLPRPLMRVSASEDGIALLGTLKAQIIALDELVGAKVTRIRTLAKFIDGKNFLNAVKPPGWNPDPNAEFSRDIFYIERKSNETKYMIEFELSSILDLENIILPQRTVLHDNCSFSYRGCGCNYEFYGRATSEHEGAYLLQNAPPVANSKNERILDILQLTSLVDKGKYAEGISYQKGDYVYIEKNNIKYYFVSKSDTAHNYMPPNINYWIADTCAKDIAACRLRWRDKNYGHGMGVLPFGGFPGVNKLS